MVSSASIVHASDSSSSSGNTSSSTTTEATSITSSARYDNGNGSPNGKCSPTTLQPSNKDGDRSTTTVGTCDLPGRSALGAPEGDSVSQSSRHEGNSSEIEKQKKRSFEDGVMNAAPSDGAYSHHSACTSALFAMHVYYCLLLISKSLSTGTLYYHYHYDGRPRDFGARKESESDGVPRRGQRRGQAPPGLLQHGNLNQCRGCVRCYVALRVLICAYAHTFNGLARALGWP